MLSGNGGINIDTSGFSARELEQLGAHQLAGVLAALRDHEQRSAGLPAGPRPHDVALYATVEAITASRVRVVEPPPAE